MESLKINIQNIVGDHTPNIDKVLSCFRKLTIPRNEFLLREGDICRNVYFVENGLLEVYIEDHNYTEKTIDLITKDDWYTDLTSFKNNHKSHVFVKARKKTIAYQINSDSFTFLMSHIPQFSEAYSHIIESKYKESQSRIIALNTMNALQRIKWVKTFKPHFSENIPDKFIASYLGISKETYCRYVKKIV